MKKNFVLVMVLLMVFAVASCSDSKKESARINKDIPLEIEVQASENLTNESSPLIVHIESKRGAKKVDFYHAVQERVETLPVPCGEYKITAIPAVNKNGSIENLKMITTKILEEPAVQKIKTKKKENVSIVKECKERKILTKIEMENIPPQKVTKKMIREITEKRAKAMKKGDKTIKKIM